MYMWAGKVQMKWTHEDAHKTHNNQNMYERIKIVNKTQQQISLLPIHNASG